MKETNQRSSPPVSNVQTMQQAGPKIPGGIEMIKESWGIYKKLWKEFISVMLWATAYSIIPFLIIFVFLAITYAVNYAKGTEVSAPFLIIQVLVSFIGVLLVMYFGFRGMIGQYILIKNIGSEIRPRQAFKESKQYVWTLIVASLAAGVLIILGYIIFIVPGIILQIWYSLTAFVIIFEGKKAFESLRRSKSLVKGYWWTTFARLLLWGIFTTVVTYIISAPEIIAEAANASEATMTVIGLVMMPVNIVYAVIILPMSLIFTYLVYKNLANIKAANAEAKEGMATGKKVGLGVIIALIVGLVVFQFVMMGAMFTTLSEMGGVSNGDFGEYNAKDLENMTDEDFMRMLQEM